MTLRPIDDQVVILRDPTADMTEGLSGAPVALGEIAKDLPMFGTVRATGPGLVLPDGRRAPVVLRAGERVVMKRTCGVVVTVEDGSDVVIAREDEILGVLEP